MLNCFVMNFDVHAMVPIAREEDVDENEEVEANLGDGEERGYKDGEDGEDECTEHEYEEDEYWRDDG
jgi:hypothetical protein